MIVARLQLVQGDGNRAVADLAGDAGFGAVGGLDQAAGAVEAYRTAAKLAPGSFPALCEAIRGDIADLMESIRESRESRARLASGDGPGNFYFYPSEKLKAAFCEGAGLSVFPA